MRIAVLSTTTVVALVSTLPANAAGPYFERVATLPVYATLPEGTDPKTQTSAEIITATPDGMTLIFTDSPGKRIGFVDIADPTAPKPAGSLAMGGEPTSATVVKTAGTGRRQHARRARPSRAAMSPWSISRHRRSRPPATSAASPIRWPPARTGRFLVVAIENERDEELNDGKIPQMPAGHVAILDLGADGRPTNCDAARIVEHDRPRSGGARGSRARVRRHQRRQHRRRHAAGEQPHRPRRPRHRQGHGPLLGRCGRSRAGSTPTAT